MESIKTVAQQSVIGLTLQAYGNLDALDKFLNDNDLTGKMSQPKYLKEEVDLGYSLLPDVEVVFDPASSLYNAKALESLAETDADGNPTIRKIIDGTVHKGVYSKQYTNQYA